MALPASSTPDPDPGHKMPPNIYNKPTFEFPFPPRTPRTLVFVLLEMRSRALLFALLLHTAAAADGLDGANVVRCSDWGWVVHLPSIENE